MSRNPHHVTREFEAALCEYTGAKYAVAVNSCTSALLLALAFNRIPTVTQYADIPKRTYVSVPMVIKQLEYQLSFRDEDWMGSYEIYPTTVYDCARRFTSGMYAPGTFQCVSFHASKILGLEQGGAILHDNPQADVWLRKARFDGRTEGVAPKDDTFTFIGFHCYMNPSTAAQGLLKLHSLPMHNADLPNDDYPDLSQMEIFK
jgi:dTDP-4-amino-4,6-dideoxygalactose transaminase